MSDSREGWTDWVRQLFQSQAFVQGVPVLLLLAGLYLISTVNFLLFHGIAEIIGIAVAFSIFVIVWNTRRHITDGFFLIIGISFLFTGSIDLVHTLAYKGMGIFPGASADLPTQLWIAARYFQSIAFLVATLFIGRSITRERKHDTLIVFAACTAACILIFTSIFLTRTFPQCYIEGAGLTPFKIASEYVISGILAVTCAVLYYKRTHFDPEVWKLLIGAQVFLILGELAFTSYVSVFGFMNMLGHLLRVVSVCLFYRVFVVISLKRPYSLLLRELREEETALRESEKRYRSLFENMMEGSAYCRMIYDDRGRPADWVYLDVNTAFERLTGLKDVVGKRVLEVIPDIREQTPELFDTYGRVASTRVPEEFEIDFKPLNIWLQVSVFSPEKGYFVAVFWDISRRKKVEQTLQEKSEELDRFFTLALDLLCIADTEGYFRKLNRAWETTLGYSQEELMAHPFLEFVHPDDLEPTLSAVGDLKDSKEVVGFVNRYRCRDGSYRWIEWRSFPYGNLIYAAARDITGRKQAEDALRRSEERLSLALEATSDGLWDWDLENDRVYWSPRAYEMLGYRPDEFPVTFTVWKELIHPDDREATETVVLTQLRKGGAFSAEFRYRMKDGTYKWVLGRGRVVMNDLQGNVTRMVGTHVDLTEQRHAQEELRESEERYRSILRASPDDITITDLQGTVEIVSPAALAIFGYSREEDILGHRIDEFLVEEDRQRAAENIALMFKGIFTGLGEYRAIRADGSIMNIEANASFLHDADGRPARIILVIRDISERKQVEKAFAQINKKLNLLSSITRHDINNQVLALKGYLDLSRDFLGDEAKISEFLLKAERVAGVIERQITFTKEYQDLGVRAPAWQDIGACIIKAEQALPMRDVRVQNELGTIAVYADLLLEKVFFNLMDNALRYGGEGLTSITISQRRQDEQVVIVFEDNGSGIPAENKSRIFDRGFGHNTGLGLYLSREILAITDITITETGEYGKGARFEITVPKGGFRF
jgi:PAS domain S-box-containing protein